MIAGLGIGVQGEGVSPSSLKIFDKLGVLTCNLVPHMLPFEIKFVLKNFLIFRSLKKSASARGHGPVTSPLCSPLDCQIFQSKLLFQSVIFGGSQVCGGQIFIQTNPRRTVAPPVFGDWEHHR